jgi:DNA-binding CsgD family transcriptional regulator
MSGVAVARRLLERDVERAQIEQVFGVAGAGNGSLLAIEGSAGIGKTRLLEEAGAMARTSGFAVLHARGGELERDHPYGLVRQLFEPVLIAASKRERAALLEGAAGLAGPVVDPRYDARPAGARPGSDPSFAVQHGLYWMTAALAGRSPLLLCADDLQWCDTPSLRWMTYLARRLDGLALLIVVALRSGEPQAPDELLVPLCSPPLAHSLQPRPLSEAAVAELVRGAVSSTSDDEFCRACHAATAGNPFLVHELITTLYNERIAPTAEEVSRVRELGPATIARAVLVRLARLPPAARALAAAASILETGGQLRHAAAICDLDENHATRAADELVQADILAPGPGLAFIHPIVRTSIHAEMAPHERASGHARAARLVAQDGASPEAVAAHLLASEPRGDQWTVDALRAAAARAAGRGVPDMAAAFLQRAVAEPPADEVRAHILVELGAAEARIRQPAAVAHLSEALELTTDPQASATTALMLGEVLMHSARSEEAIAVLQDAIARLGGADAELELRLEAQLVAAAENNSSTRPLATERLSRFGSRMAGHTPAQRLLLANLAVEALAAGEPASQVADLAERALAHGRLLAEQSADSQPFYMAVNMLCVSDRLDLADQCLRAALEDARARGSLLGFALASCLRSSNNYRRGALGDAEADARNALDAAGVHGWQLGPAALAGLLDALIERGELAQADDTLQQSEIPDELPDLAFFDFLLYTRGTLRVAKGDTRSGLSDLLLCGTRQRALGVANPALLAWRSTAALAHAALGEGDAARRLAAEEVELARAFGAPRALGIALRAAGLIGRDQGGLDLLHEATAVLESSPARLEHARALTDYGAALRRAARRTDAREPLRQGLDLAHRCGAHALVDRARRELVDAGARPRRIPLVGPDALTPSERRIADMASNGLSNRQIAQALFLSLKTIETHLTHIYQKLDINSRTQLASALPDEP